MHQIVCIFAHFGPCLRRNGSFPLPFVALLALNSTRLSPIPVCSCTICITSYQALLGYVDVASLVPMLHHSVRSVRYTLDLPWLVGS
jgi:hypothetical protein